MYVVISGMLVFGVGKEFLLHFGYVFLTVSRVWIFWPLKTVEKQKHEGPLKAQERT